MERKHSPLSKFFDVVDKLEDILCGGTLVCLLLVVLLQVGGRLVGVTLTWTEETTRFFFLWMMFLAVAAGFNRAESSRVVILVNMLPRPMQKVCTVLYYVVTLGFFAFMVKYGIDLTMQKFAFNEMATAVAIPNRARHSALNKIKSANRQITRLPSIPNNGIRPSSPIISGLEETIGSCHLFKNAYSEIIVTGTSTQSPVSGSSSQVDPS